jgi:Zn-finger nucleic acid-binding protein
MMTALAVIFTILVFAVAGVLYRGMEPVRQCPTCRIDYDVIAEAGAGPNLSYDILACPQCANTATRVHGSHAHLAYCPACRNRSLETASVRTAVQPPVVEIRESCHLCEFQRSYEVRGEEPAPLAEVIPFPVRRRDDESAEG